MTFAWVRSQGSAVTAVGLLVLDLVLRMVASGPYRGATALLLAACATVVLPLLPAELARPSLAAAAFPTLALGSFTILVTTLSTVGIPLTETSIRAAVLVYVAGGAVLGTAARRPETSSRRSTKHEMAGVAAVLMLAAFSFASAWNVVGPFPPRGTDWGHYYLYADEVQRQKSLLIEDRFSGQEGQLFADPAMVGALYGGMRVLDGVSSRSFSPGAAVASAFSTMSVAAAAGGLWGLGAAVAGGALYSVAPIRMDPMYWHGLATTLALVFLPFVVLALGLMFRGRRDPRTVGLLGLALASIAAAHTTTAVVVALTIVAAAIIDGVRSAFARPTGVDEGFLRRWWQHGVVAPLLAGVAVAFTVGSGVVVHVARQTRNLGHPVNYRFFDPDWLSWNTLDEYLSNEFLLLACVSLLVVVLWRRSPSDPALLAVAAVVLASIAVTQLWRLGIPYEYRRAVYPFGLALALLVGAAAARVERWKIVAPLGIVVCIYFAHRSVGLRLPERLLSEHVPTSSAPAALDSVRGRIDRGELSDTRLVVADRCLHFLVPYLLHRPTIAAFEEWQVAYANRLPAARKAATILAGGPEGRRLADDLGVRYVVADPRCTPDPAPGLDGTPVARTDDVVVLELPPG